MCKERNLEASPSADLLVRRRPAAVARPSPKKPAKRLSLGCVKARINLNEHWDALEEAYLQREAMRSALTARLVAQRNYRTSADSISTTTTLSADSTTTTLAYSPTTTSPHQKALALPTVGFVLHTEQKERLSRTLNALLRICKERKS